jgi:Zn-dependent peptidase ImmA (M78 family)/transcriptional regulator with XRE-family HTH domain
LSIGARIKQLRTARGHSLGDLAQAMNGLVTKQSLSKYENDRATPRPTVLIALARALDVKAAQLVAAPRYEFEVVAYRALASLPKRERQAIENRVELELESRLLLMDRLGIAPLVPFAGKPIDVCSLAATEDAAARLRDEWELGNGPIASVVDALEARDVHLIDVDTDRKFDGLAVFAKDESGTRVACGVATRREASKARQRMSHAHELGHLAMWLAEDIDAERAASRFAGAFLFPEHAVRAEFGDRRSRVTTDELLIAKKRWGMSIQAVLYRLQELEVLDDASYKWWCMRINRAGWKSSEPGDEPAEISSWVRTYAHRAAAEGLIAQETLAEYLPRAETRSLGGDLDRRALARLPLADRRAVLKAHAEAVADEYNVGLDTEWLEADLTDG